jgi:uncharacterized membrane protein
MTLQPLLAAPLAVQAHVGTLLLAFAIGTWVLFFSRKGSRMHRAFGAAFLALMVCTATIAVFIHLKMPNSPVFGLSPTHLLVAFVLFAVWRALDGALKGDIRQHRTWILGLYFGSLVINGFFNVFISAGMGAHCYYISIPLIPPAPAA